jgi:tetratricopeptide (TPR) repeat protein
MITNTIKTEGESLLDQGHSAAWAQDWERAASLYMQALKLMPDEPKILMNLGLSYYQLNKWNEALKYYKDAVRVSQSNPLAWEKLALVYEKLNQPDQAAKYASYAGELYLKIHDIQKTIENWVRAVGNQPEDIQVHQRLAFLFEKIGQKSQAAREHLTLASLFQASGDKEKTQQSVRQALALVPDNKEAKKVLELLSSGGKLPLPQKPATPLSPARPVIQTNQEQTAAPASPANLTPIEQAHQTAQQSLANLVFSDEGMSTDLEAAEPQRGIQAVLKGAQQRMSRKVDTKLISLYVGHALELNLKNKINQAGEELDRAINAGLTIPAAYFELGYCHYQAERLESALRYLNKSALHDDFGLGSHLLMGKIYSKMERVDDAFDEYLQALRLADLRTTGEQARKEISQLYESAIETLIQKVPEEEKVEINKRIADLVNREDWVSFINQARQQLKTGQDRGQHYALLELVSQAGGTKLIDSLNRLNELVRIGSLSTALEEAFFLLEDSPNYLPLHVVIGDILLKLGRINAGIEKLTTVARVYELRNEPERALEIYQRMVELVPVSDEPRKQLNSLLKNMGRNEQALQGYIDLAEVYFNLADLDLAREIYQEAIQFTEQNESLRGWRVKIIKRLADIEMQCLNWQQALKLYEQASRQDLGDFESRLKMVDLYRRLGKPDKASDETNKYLFQLRSAGKIEQIDKFTEALHQQFPDWEESITTKHETM